MKVLSLFSGGGLGDYGLELAGMEIVGQVEIDEFCQEILKKRWPEVHKWHDIKTFKGQVIEDVKKLGPIDLISGGFPCQDISVAGRGVGIKGERSGLWKEMLRIIREIRPRYVLVENVTALLGRGIGVVLGDLSEIRYDCEWDCISASAVGAPHQRDRVWMVAYANSSRWNDGKYTQRENKNNIHEERKSEKNQQSGSGRKYRFSQVCKNNLANSVSDSAGSTHRSKIGKCGNGWKEQNIGKGSEMGSDARDGSEDVAHTSCEFRKWSRSQKSNKVSESSNRGEIKFSQSNPGRIFDRKCKKNGYFWAVEPNVGRVAHGVAKRVDRLKLLGNGQVCQVVEWIGHQIIEFDKTRLEYDKIKS